MSDLQIKRGFKDNSKIFFFSPADNICCDPTLETSRRDSYNEGSQHMFFYEEILKTIPKLAVYPLLSATLYSVYMK